MSLVHSSAEDGASIPTETGPLTVAQILNRATVLIERDGTWIKGEYRKRRDVGDGEATCYCALGAVLQAGGGVHRDENDDPACRALADSLGLSAAHLVARWNDAPERTQAEVVAALRAAALKADTNSPSATPLGTSESE